MDERQLLEKKERCDQVKLKISELEGRAGYLTTEVKETWKCNTLDELKERIKKKTEEVEGLKKAIKDGESKLRGENGWA